MRAPLSDPEQLKELLGIPFTPEQTACITAPPAPQVVVAGAGSGKTTVMAARVVWLVGTGQVAPEQVLGLTFTNKAAGELAERVATALVRAGVRDPDGPVPEESPDGTPAGEPVISTYHAFAGRLLADHGLRLGLEPSSRLLADATRYQLAARVLREAPGPYPALTRSFADLVGDLLALDAELAEHLVEPRSLRRHDDELLLRLGSTRLSNADLRKIPDAARARRELLGLVERYRAAKRERDLLDFGDQIAHGARLGRDHAEVGALLREEFRVVMLDEYQDTSVAQRVLLAGLFGGGTGHPVTAVGDPCQAIYGWRGASVANLDDFPLHFARRDGSPAVRQALSENRRSGGRLLELANSLAEPLRSLHDGVEALRPAPGAERDGLVRTALLPTQAEEIDWLAGSIAHLVRTGTAPGEIAVLCRTAGDFARIQEALVAQDVPVEVVGLSGLLHLPEIADLVAVCEVLQDPGANAALVRLLTGPRWRIGPRDLALLGRRARLLAGGPARAGKDDELELRLADAVEGTDPAELVSLADALDTFLAGEAGAGGRDAREPRGPGRADCPTGPQGDDGLPFSDEARRRFARLATELRELRRSLSDPLMDVLHRVLSVTGLEVELSASPQALAARRRETLANFLDVAASFAASESEANLLAFLGFLRTAERYEKGLDNALPGGENTVKVLTAHKAKGLEWDVVAVPGLVKGTFPSGQGREKWTAQARVLPHSLRGDAATLPELDTFDARSLAAFAEEMKEHQRTEELRLGYVTFTRPRSLLLGSGHWWGPTQKRRRGPSDFLLALAAHCDSGYGETEAWAEEPAEDAENPALLGSAEQETRWPLPLDPAGLARRRSAARTVLAHLERLAAAEHVTVQEESGPGQGAPTDEEPYGDELEDFVEHDDFVEPDDLVEPDDPELHELQEMDEGAPEEDLGDWENWAPAPAPVTAEGAGAGVADASDNDAPDSDAPDDDSESSDGENASDATPAPPTAPAPTTPAPPTAPAPTAPAPRASAENLTPEEARAVASWDRDLRALTGELLSARRTVTEIPLPATLTATQLLRLASDPAGLARETARPMPRPPRPSARRGTRFHAWMQSRHEQVALPLLGIDEVPGEEEDIRDEEELQALKDAFGRSDWARRTPYRVEAAVQIVLAGRVLRGRVDAVYRTAPGTPEAEAGLRYEIVDWKTGRAAEADPLQLAVYRLAWAEQQRVPAEAVGAAFHFVRSGRTVRPSDLPGRAELERLLTEGPGGQDPSGRRTAGRHPAE